MTSKQWEIKRQRVPLEQCQQASHEAQELYLHFGEYSAGIAKLTEPADPTECTFLNFRLFNTDAIQNFYTLAPTIGNILLSYCGMQPSFGRVPSDYFPTGITINFANPKTHVPSHIDLGNGNEVSYITTLCGQADFTIEGHYKEFSHDIEVAPGDVHILHNPPEYEQRLWHGAQTTGSESRISLAARLPLLHG